MRIMIADIETYFDTTYTLKKLTCEAYIRNPQFEFHGLGYQWLDEEQGTWVDGPDLREWVASIDWATTGVVCHHAQFDLLALGHWLGVRPGFIFDTLSMARMVHGNHVSASLESLARCYGGGSKTVPYDRMRGLRWCNMPLELRRELADGCLQDVHLTRWIFRRLLLEGFPDEELRVIDQTCRMFVEPRLLGDVGLIYEVQREEWQRKNEILMELGVSESVLASTPQFCRLIENEGIEIEYKTTATGETPAVAKTDQFLQELVEDANPRVAALAAARIEIKSTIDETRAGRLAAMAARGPLCVYLSCNGAHTLRWSGGDKINFQNFPREGKLRQGIQAPPGYKLIPVDLNQIECRLLCWLAGEHDFVRAVAAGDDVYSRLAETIYGRAVNKKDNPKERQVGKIVTLGSGYGMGWKRLQSVLYAATGELPSEEFAQGATQAYRRSHKPVENLWYELNDALRMMYYEQPFDLFDGLLHYDHTRGRLYGPNGTWMTYELQWHEGEFRRKTRSGWRNIWGGGLTENIIQYLARIVMSQAALRIEDRFGLRPVLTCHDELVYLCGEDSAEADLAGIVEEMSRSPSWCPDIPLGAEGKIMERYGK